MLFDPILILFGYLTGSISAAIITCKLMGLPDPRSTGSKNPGATNVLRLGGKKAAIITLAGDLIKGLVPVLVAHLLGASEVVLALTGLAAFLGHLYPVFFGFKGGKGVATALGVYFGLSWQAGLVFVACWLIIAAITRISSLSALIATLAIPVFFYTQVGAPWMSAATIVMAILIYWRHRSNIRNMLNGKEKRIGQKG
ncbi:MAG: glycerol-3-phosphate 1-O-acyltransferase PlsY [Gammaproteobacteria bacterium]|nr:glycerol-3-phosphate 1-O-acyltransferase PlsY [Gammaproteobacteria bacterium]